jgi:hypothetical protein
VHTSSTHSLKILVLAVLALTTVTVTAIACIIPQALFAAVGLAALLVVATPMLAQKHIDWFSPWTFVILTVTLGCTFTGICMSCLWPDPDRIEAFFLMGEQPSYFIYPSLVLLGGLTAMALGYFGRTGRTGTQRRVTTWSETRLQFVLLALLFVSLYATYSYVQNTGGLSSGKLSGKRTVISDLDVRGDSEFNQYGHLREVAKLASLAYLIFLSFCLSDARGLTPGRILLLTVLFLAGCALPFYSSSRLPIVWLFCGTGAIVWYSGRTVRWGRIAAIAAVGFALFHVMSVIRGKDELLVNLQEKTGIGSMVDGFVLTRNYCGLAKSSHIINAVPEVLDLEYGKTIGVWLFAPIPRSLWIDKPMVHSGPLIGAKIYGNRVSGIPPGLIAELYWNFHLPGVLIGGWLFGFILKSMADWLRPARGQASLHAAVYVVGPMRLGFEILGNSIGFGVIITMIDIVTALVVLRLIGTRVRPTVTGQSVVGLPARTISARAA